MGVNDFDRIAGFYDFLANMVFGGRLLRSQKAMLRYLNDTDLVLILGGGTGQILNFTPLVKRVDYLEKSVKMMKRAKKRKCASEVLFFEVDFFEFQSSIKYDVVICPFFLDCFNEQNLSIAIEKIRSLLSLDGKLIVIDFENIPTLLDLAMHFFFRQTAKLESTVLKPIHQKIIRSDFDLVDERKFLEKRVFARLYQKPYLRTIQTN